MIEGGRSKCGGVCWRRVGFAIARRMDESINISAVAIPDMSTTGAYRHKPHPHRWPKPVKTLYQLVRPNMMFQVLNTVRYPALSTPPPLYPRRQLQTAAEQPDSGDNGEGRYAETGLPVHKGTKSHRCIPGNKYTPALKPLSRTYERVRRAVPGSN